MLLKLTLSATVLSIFEKGEKPRPPMEPGTEFHLSGVRGTVVMAFPSQAHTYVVDFWGLADPKVTYAKQWLEVVKTTLNASKVTTIRKSDFGSEIMIDVEAVPVE